MSKRALSSASNLITTLFLIIIAAAVAYAATALPYGKAMVLIYRSWWFVAIWVVLALYLIFCSVASKPSVHRAGLLAMHLGFVILIAGGLLTYRGAIRGTLEVEEGQSASSFSLDDLHVSAATGNEKAELALGSLLYDEDSPQQISASMRLPKSGLVITAEKYVPDPQEVLPTVAEVVDGLGRQALELSAEVGDKTTQIVLFACGEEESFRGYKFRFSEFLNEGAYQQRIISLPRSAGAPQPRERLIVTVDGNTETVALPGGSANVGFSHTLMDGCGEIEVLAYVPDFELGPGRSVRSRSQEPNNPAIEVQLESGGSSTRLWLFGKSKPFHRLNLPEGTKIDYLFGAGEQAEMVSKMASSVELTASTDGLFAVVVAGVLVGQVRLGQRVEAEGLSLSVDKFWPSARRTFDVVEGRSRKKTGKCVSVVIRRDSEQVIAREWLPEGEAVQVPLAKAPLVLTAFVPTQDLGFQVFLKGFETKTYPGSRIPSAYVSEVEVTGAGEAEIRFVSPNNPLSRNGYTLYQSAYDRMEDGSYVSIFGVSSDPGRFEFYLGSALVVLGLIAQPLLRRRRRSQQP